MTLTSYGNKRLKSSLGSIVRPFHTKLRCPNVPLLKYDVQIQYPNRERDPRRHLNVVHSCVRLLSSKKQDYYDILQITPKATQAQVKLAYYDLSKQYHPDQYKGKEDAAFKFRQITEAYEVLGNFQKRRMYDKGFLNMEVAAAPKEAEKYASKFYESRGMRGKIPTQTGRTPIFNFDEWSSNHYESSFERKQHMKAAYERKLRMEAANISEKKSRSIIYILVFVTAVIALSGTSENLDPPNLIQSSKPPKS